ncbi:MAG: prepilin peptidase [Candidatus Pacearchaeota archaeon]
MDKNFFLILLAFIWIILAIIQDIKKREVENWINFSLIIFALTYRLFYSLFFDEWRFFLYGVIGLFIFLVLGNIFYYSRIFAGGDAKLLIALGTILPFSLYFKENIKIFSIFILSLLLFGGIYGFIYSFFIIYSNKKKFFFFFKKDLEKRKFIFIFSIILALILFIFSLFINEIFFSFFSFLFIIFPLIYIYSKSLEELMVKEIETKNLTEGDWLYEEISINKKIIKPNWEGLTKEEIELLKKHKKKVKIKQGIPFTPSFLFAFIFTLILWYSSRKFINFFF